MQATFYTALMHHVGCVGYSHETAQLFGNELVANIAAARTDPASFRDMVATFSPTLTQGRAPIDRARLTLTALTKGDRWGSEFTTTSCEVGRDSARPLQLSQDVQSSLFHVFDKWRGKGGAHSLNDDDIPIAARTARLTGIAVLFESIGRTDGAVQALRRRAGGMLDPTLVACFTDHAAAWLGELAGSDARTVVLSAERHPRVTVPGPQLVTEVFADLADLKSPYLRGHSRAVAALASGAAARLRLREATRDDLGIAGLLHDVGRVAIFNAVWDKPGRLTADEWESVRLHPYHSERILAGPPSSNGSFLWSADITNGWTAAATTAARMAKTFRWRPASSRRPRPQEVGTADAQAGNAVALQCADPEILQPRLCATA